jgi:hypothetical protein
MPSVIVPSPSRHPAVEAEGGRQLCKNAQITTGDESTASYGMSARCRKFCKRRQGNGQLLPVGGGQRAFPVATCCREKHDEGGTGSMGEEAM